LFAIESAPHIIATGIPYLFYISLLTHILFACQDSRERSLFHFLVKITFISKTLFRFLKKIIISSVEFRKKEGGKF